MGNIPSARGYRSQTHHCEAKIEIDDAWKFSACVRTKGLGEKHFAASQKIEFCVEPEDFDIRIELFAGDKERHLLSDISIPFDLWNIQDGGLPIAIRLNFETLDVGTYFRDAKSAKRWFDQCYEAATTTSASALSYVFHLRSLPFYHANPTWKHPASQLSTQQQTFQSPAPSQESVCHTQSPPYVGTIPRLEYPTGSSGSAVPKHAGVPVPVSAEEWNGVDQMSRIRAQEADLAVQDSRRIQLALEEEIRTMRGKLQDQAELRERVAEVEADNTLLKEQLKMRDSMSPTAASTSLHIALQNEVPTPDKVALEASPKLAQEVERLKSIVSDQENDLKEATEKSMQDGELLIDKDQEIQLLERICCELESDLVTFQEQRTPSEEEDRLRHELQDQKNLVKRMEDSQADVAERAMALKDLFLPAESCYMTQH